MGLAPKRGLRGVAGFVLRVARSALIWVTQRGVLDLYAPILVFEGVNDIQSTCTLYFMEPIQIIGTINEVHILSLLRQKMHILVD